MAEEGLALFNEGRYAEAYERFRKASELYRAPTIALYLARSAKGLGRLIEARDLYQKVISEPIPPNAAPQYKKARDDATTELAELQSKIPILTIVVIGAGTDAARVSVDDRELSDAEMQGVALDPGSHSVKAWSRAEAGKREKTVTLKEGARERIELDVSPTGEPSGARPSEDAARARTFLLASGIATGLGIVGIGAGTITGVMAMNRIDDLKNRCGGTRCPPSEQPEGQSIRGVANASTACMVVGAVGVAAGVTLFVLHRASKSQAASAPSALLRTGFGSIHAEGTF